MTRCQIRCTINGKPRQLEVEARHTVVDVLREQLRLTGTHAGCEHGECGACTVLVDSEPVRSCLMFGPQLDGKEVTTVEGLAAAGAALHPLQESFTAHGALQCGFCTPGMLLTALDLLTHNPTPTREEVRAALSANLCRCTGYGQIIDAVMDAARGGAFDRESLKDRGP
ncbi:MAG: (2Fe-2S)-binding protein [Acidimicrobiales bacterium]